MTRSGMLLVMAVGLSAAACSTTTYTTTAVAPAGPVVLTSSEQACVDYGFSPGTVPYDRCVSREHESRLRGRVVYGYSEAQLAADARSACNSYGLTSGTGGYDRCVGRELDARRFRDSTASVYVPAPAPSYTTVYTPPAIPRHLRRRPMSKAGMRITPEFRPLGTSMVSAMMPKVTGSIGTGTSSARSRRSLRGIDGGTACVDLCSGWFGGHGVQRYSAEA